MCNFELNSLWRMTLTGLITKNNHTALFLVNYCILYQGSARVPEKFHSPGPSPGFFDTSRSQSRIPDFSVPEISVPDPANYEFESRSQPRIPDFPNFNSGPSPRSRKLWVWVPVPVPDFKRSPGPCPRFPGPRLRQFVIYHILIK